MAHSETTFHLPVRLFFDPGQATAEAAVEEFYLTLAQVGEAGFLDRQLIEITYGDPVEHAGPTARFGLDKHRAGEFLSRARRRHAGVWNPGQGDSAGPDESWALDPAWDLDTILSGQAGHVEDLVHQAVHIARAITCTNPQVSIALAIAGQPGQDWVYQWHVTLSGPTGFTICSPAWQDVRQLGRDAASGTRATGRRAAMAILREAVARGNELLAAYATAGGRMPPAASAADPARAGAGPHEELPAVGPVSPAGREYQGYIRYADDTIVSLQCFEGDHGQCPDVTRAGEGNDNGPLDGYHCECPGCPRHPGAGDTPASPVIFRFFGAELRWFSADEEENDHSDMYVLDALGISTLVRRRADDTYIHIDTLELPGPPRMPLAVEVNNGGEAIHGDAG
jgi:hypothetical protein